MVDKRLINTAPTKPDLPANVFAKNPFDPRVEGARGRKSSLEAILAFMKPEDLSVVFQPIVHVEPLRVFAYEALVRCKVPEFSNPTVLFERAVQDQCCGRLGRMIREVAVPLCAGKPIFLNLHPFELREQWLVRPDDPMFFHDHDVYLEVTESVPMTHFELCQDVLNEVRSRGNMYLVVDDLGAGYSNFKRIADLEPKVVKLDRGLIAGTTHNSRQQKLVAGVVRLCEDLGAKVVAEGIETAEEFAALKETGIHYAQGYYFARPGFPLPAVAGADPNPSPLPRRPTADTTGKHGAQTGNLPSGATRVPNANLGQSAQRAASDPSPPTDRNKNR